MPIYACNCFAFHKYAVCKHTSTAEVKDVTNVCIADRKDPTIVHTQRAAAPVGTVIGTVNGVNVHVGDIIRYSSVSLGDGALGVITGGNRQGSRVYANFLRHDGFLQTTVCISDPSFNTKVVQLYEGADMGTGVNNSTCAVNSGINTAGPDALKLYSGVVIGKDSDGNSTGVLFKADEILAPNDARAQTILLIRAVNAGKVNELTVFVASVTKLG